MPGFGASLAAPLSFGAESRASWASRRAVADARKNRLTGRKARQEPPDQPRYHSPRAGRVTVVSPVAKRDPPGPPPATVRPGVVSRPEVPRGKEGCMRTLFRSPHSGVAGLWAAP